MAEWFQRSVNRRILAAILTVGAFSLAVKVTATIKELVVAYRFGTGDAVDAFLIAFLLPSLITNIIAGSFNAAFTPVYIETRERIGAPAARRLFGTATLASALVVLSVIGVLALVAPLAARTLVGSFSEAKLALTKSLFFVLLPTVLLSAVVALWSAVLNAEEQFASVALAPICVPLLAVGTVVVASRSWGIYALALGTLFGFVAQCGVLAIELRRHGLRVLPSWTGMTPELKRVASQYLPMVAGAALMSGSWAIGQVMAASLPAGSVASLNYGNKVVAMVSEIGSMALATAVLPHFSLMVARQDWVSIRRTVRVYVRLIVSTIVPTTLLLILFSRPLVRLLFERGAFTSADTSLVGTIQALYLLQIPFVMIGMLFVRLASSLQKNGILLGGAAITLPLNVLLNVALRRGLGVGGIALATSIVFGVSCCYLAVTVTRALSREEKRLAPAADGQSRSSSGNRPGVT